MPALVAVFVLVPLAELFVAVWISRHVGLGPTLASLLIVGVIGGLLVKREGLRAWRALRAALSAGRVPGREVADAALILVGGTLLVTPGFLTDVVGLLLVLPVTRPQARRLALAVAARQVRRRGRVIGSGPPAGR